MDYQVVVSPTLGMSAAEFITAWNDAPQSRNKAQASLADKSTTVSFDLDPTLLQQGLILLSGIAGGITIDAIKDLAKERLKSYLERKFPQKQPAVDVEAIRPPGGAYLLVIKEAE